MRKVIKDIIAQNKSFVINAICNILSLSDHAFLYGKIHVFGI